MAYMSEDELYQQISWMNTSGGFADALVAEKVVEAAAKVKREHVEKLFKDLEEKKDTVKDPTAWITSAMRKASGGVGKNQTAEQADQQLRKKIGWLNGEGGGFEGAIIYDKVVAAAGGLAYADVMKVLQNVEEKKGEVKDPTAWICAGLRKAGGGQAPPTVAWAGPPPGFGGAWGAPPGAGAWGAPAWVPPAGQQDPAFDSKVRKRVEWLNTQGGFEGALVSQKVLEAAAGVDLTKVFSILKDVEEKKDQVKDALAYVTSALRKAGGGVRGGSGGLPAAAWGGPGPQAWGGPPPPAWAGVPGGKGGFGGSAVATEDTKLRKRIGWLNGQGGFEGGIIYDKVLEAAGGLEFSEVFTKLQQLEEKKGRGEGITDPTAWVCAGLRKSAAKKGQGPQGGQMAVAAWSGPPQPQWAPPSASYGGGSIPMDVDDGAKLRKKVNWLNGKGGFNNTLDFEKVCQAAAGVDSSTQMTILKDLEEKRHEVKNPLAYVTSALRKAGGGAGAGKGAGKGVMPGVKKTISKYH